MTNILVVGDGAIGLLFSHFLSAQHNVNVLTRKTPITHAFTAEMATLQKK